MAEFRPDQPMAEEMYVGYLPVPAGYRRFLRFAIPGILWIMVAVAFVIARSQPAPGQGVWDDAQARSFTGTIVAHPYPMVYADDRGDGKPGAVLLVETGKHGGEQRAAMVDGQRARISGWPLHRDGRFMVELEPGADALRAEPGPSTPAPEPRAIGRVTLRGEIMDSKCFLGAMKPGEGRTHKECATLCISGGIPPMLVTRDAAGAATYYLLLNPEGAPLDKEAYEFIADPVEVSGELESAGGLLRLRVGPADIRRL